jgi:pimeloyl-ACP methyl ester carboxylesterase
MIGHSMGGYVTLEFAGKYPEMINGFGLFHSHALPDSSEGKENRNRIIETVKKNHKNFLNSFIPDLFSTENSAHYTKDIERLLLIANNTSADAIIAGMAGMRERENRMNVLKNAKCPVLFIFGRHDKRLPVPLALEQAVLPYTSDIYILGNASHMGFIEARNETLIAIQAFAKKYL